MGLFSKIFKKNTTVTDLTVNKTFDNPECQNLWDLKMFMDGLLRSDKYVAKSEYFYVLKESYKTIEYFAVLENSGLLKTFCKNNEITLSDVEHTLYKYSNFEDLVDDHNNSFIKHAMVSEKAYLDNILADVDPVIKLDDDQRKVVLTDEDYCLVIAGAGAGKTTTVAAKVKYLVEKKNIDPKKILVISFTNKAVQELREKINEDLHIECPIATFHSTGNAILKKQSPDKLNIVDQSKLYFVIK